MRFYVQKDGKGVSGMMMETNHPQDHELIKKILQVAKYGGDIFIKPCDRVRVVFRYPRRKKGR